MRGLTVDRAIAKDVPFKGLENDVVILVMGPTGAGKSTFIRNVLHDLEYAGPKPDTSDAFDSCTRTLAAYATPLPIEFATIAGQRLVLVDTPGLCNSESVRDPDIFQGCGNWLASSYNSGMKADAMMYLFPLSGGRITGSEQTNLKAFRKLCGKGSLAKVRMVTTKWAFCPNEQVGRACEEQLRLNAWKDMLEGGSEISRLDDNKASARMVLNEVLKKRKDMDVALATVREITEKLGSLPNTEEGRELKAKLQQSLQEYRAASGDLQTRREKLRIIIKRLSEKMSFPEGIRAHLGLQGPSTSRNDTRVDHPVGDPESIRPALTA